MPTTGADTVPWPPAEWEAMQNEASIWRARWRALPDAGTLFLLDGASCSGKSTLVDRLAADAQQLGPRLGPAGRPDGHLKAAGRPQRQPPPLAQLTIFAICPIRYFTTG